MKTKLYYHFLDAGNSIKYAADDILRLESEKESLLKKYQQVEKKITELTEELESDVKLHFTTDEIEEAKELYKKQFLTQF